MILGIWGMETFLLRADAMAGQESVLGQILLFFTKAGAFVFGSGLAIVPFLEQGSCTSSGWLTDHQFLDAVAVAMITPGPVVITVAFIVSGRGDGSAIVASIGIFLPVYIFTIIPAPWFQRHRANPQPQAFAAGATAAASGAIAGAVVVLGQRAIFDPPTAAMGVIGPGTLWKFRVQEPRSWPRPAWLASWSGPGPRWMTAAHHTAASARRSAPPGVPAAPRRWTRRNLVCTRAGRSQHEPEGQGERCEERRADKVHIRTSCEGRRCTHAHLRTSLLRTTSGLEETHALGWGRQCARVPSPRQAYERSAVCLASRSIVLAPSCARRW